MIASDLGSSFRPRWLCVWGTVVPSSSDLQPVMCLWCQVMPPTGGSPAQWKPPGGAVVTDSLLEAEGMCPWESLAGAELQGTVLGALTPRGTPRPQLPVTVI